MVANAFTTQGSQGEVLDEIVTENVFKHVKNEYNIVSLEDDEIKIKNLTTKANKKSGKQGNSFVGHSKIDEVVLYKNDYGKWRI